MTPLGGVPAGRDREVSDCEVLVKQPLVSVLMLAYNHGPYIRQAIASILEQQTTFPFELLIGEDASTDATREIALKYQRAAPDRIRVMYSDLNVGMNANHGRLMGAARGEFIAYCEGDDYWLDSNKLQKQVEFMRRNPRCGLVHGNYVNLVKVAGTWRTRLAFRKPKQLEHRTGHIYPAMLQANRIQTCTVLAKRELIDQYRTSGPGVDSYRVGDWPEFLYVTHEAATGFINEPLAAYRRTPGSVTNSGSAAKVELGVDAIRMIGEFCDYFRDTESTRRLALTVQYQTLMRLAFRAGDQLRFNQARHWISVNQTNAPLSLKALAMSVLIKLPGFTRILVRLFLRVEAVVQRIIFRKLRPARITNGTHVL